MRQNFSLNALKIYVMLEDFWFLFQFWKVIYDIEKPLENILKEFRTEKN